MLAFVSSVRPTPPEPRNFVANGDFALAGSDPDDPVPGWRVELGDPRSRALVHDVFNTPPGDLVLDLAARHGDRVTVRQRVAVPGPDLYFTVALRARSTRGDARVELHLLDAAGDLLGTVGWVVVGDLPACSDHALWIDERFWANYLGREIMPVVHLGKLLAQHLPSVAAARLAGVEIVLSAADGNHVLYNHVYLGTRRPEVRPGSTGWVGRQIPVDPAPPETVADEFSPQPYLRIDRTWAELTLGQTFTVRTTLTGPLPEVTLAAVEPYGFGLVIRSGGSRAVVVGPLGPGEEASVSWEVRGQRPHAVNLDRPWTARFRAGQAEVAVEVLVWDPEPGVLYYVLTNDLEPMDGAGYPGPATGNRNGWLDPEEFQVQMVDKVRELNRIAEAHGARWSHYVAWPAVLAAKWAAERSSTGRWEAVIAEIEQSVREGASRGHQYSPHLHMDYDPRLPGNVLTYDAATDGFWANHNEHGWAHQTRPGGEPGDVTSRTGSLHWYVAALESLTRRQELAVRTGSFDFGILPGDVRASVAAFRRSGLWGGADAEGRMEPQEAVERGLNVYFSSPGDITRRAEELQDLGVVQFLPGPAGATVPEWDSVETMNAKIAAAFEAFAPGGRPRPGVHAVSLFTHAMFMLGDGGWQSTRGGAFDRLDRHLAHVRQTYAGRGLVFATSTELVAAFLDYHTPVLLARRGPEHRPAPGVYEYPIELLGRDIPLGDGYVHWVTVGYPLYLREQAVRVEVWRDGRPIASLGERELPSFTDEISFAVAGPGSYLLRVLTES